MTELDALKLATQRARDLNWPWDEDSVTIKRFRPWPLPVLWSVTSYVKQENATALIRVYERRKRPIVNPVRVIYRKPQ
jgi:hypothetical protein